MRSIWEILQKADGSSLALAVWGMYFGVLLACFLALYEKRVIGGFVRALLKKEAFSPEKAATLQELGYGKNPFVRRALRGKTALSALVYMPGEDPQITGGSEEAGPLHSVPAIRNTAAVKAGDARFYIPDALRHRAALRFDQHGTHLMAVVVGAAVFAFLAALLVWAVPEVTSFAKNAFAYLLSDF